MDRTSIYILGAVYCVLIVALLYGLPLLMPRYRARIEGQRLSSMSFGSGPRPRTPHSESRGFMARLEQLGDQALVAIGLLLLTLVVNLLAWATGAWW